MSSLDYSKQATLINHVMRLAGARSVENLANMVDMSSCVLRSNYRGDTAMTEKTLKKFQKVVALDIKMMADMAGMVSKKEKKTHEFFQAVSNGVRMARVYKEGKLEFRAY